MCKFFPAQMRSEHAANRPLINGSVAMATDVPVDRADVQAGSAADTMQDLPLFGVGQQPAAAVIHQHHVKFFGSISLSGALGTSDQSAIRSHRLASARS